MAEQYRFFDHVDGDRVYNADEFAEYFRQVLTSGVLNGGTNLQVYCNGTDRIARIKPGKAWLEGYFYKNTEELELQLDEAHGTYDRIDRIVLRLDRNPENRYIKAFVKTGIPSMSPVPPALIREGLVYEISLAQILVVHNTTVIPVNKVTDERLNASVCGLVNSLIQVDTTTMQAEFDAFMAYLQTQGYVPQVDFLNHLNTADPHSQYALKETLNEHLEDNTAHGVDTKIPKTLATAADQFLVSSGAGSWVIKTVAQIKTLLGLKSAAYTESSAYATADQGTKADNALPKAGGTMTGILTAQSNTSYTVRQVRNIILSTADADVGAMQNGDIWIKYK